MRVSKKAVNIAQTLNKKVGMMLMMKFCKDYDNMTNDELFKVLGIKSKKEKDSIISQLLEVTTEIKKIGEVKIFNKNLDINPLVDFKQKTDIEFDEWMKENEITPQPLIATTINVTVPDDKIIELESKIASMSLLSGENEKLIEELQKENENLKKENKIAIEKVLEQDEIICNLRQELERIKSTIEDKQVTIDKQFYEIELKNKEINSMGTQISALKFVNGKGRFRQ